MTRSFYTPPSGPVQERAYLVGVTLPGRIREEEVENLEELRLLAETAGARVEGSTIQNRTRIDGSTYIGGGKITALSREIFDGGVNLVIFDDDLTPAQARNIESKLGINVIDRTQLILDIFARRARTRQARIQVEMAQLAYALPRLRRLWEHLSRQAGGIGTRGPGETQLEVDRRRVREKISHLKEELRKIEKRVGERRKRRKAQPRATIVGYTNAGKSTLLNRLAGSGVLENERLFSTLDSTTRRVTGVSGETFLLTDTVGFIRKLPTHLVESFKATLADVRDADLLIHLVDAARPGFEGRIEIVSRILGEVIDRPLTEGHVPPIPTQIVLNKIDLIDDRDHRAALLRRYPDAIPVSAATGDGCGELVGALENYLERDTVLAEIEVSVENGKAIALVEAKARVLSRRSRDGRMHFTARVRKKDLSSLERVVLVRIKPLEDGPAGGA